MFKKTPKSVLTALRNAGVEANSVPLDGYVGLDGYDATIYLSNGQHALQIGDTGYEIRIERLPWPKGATPEAVGDAVFEVAMWRMK